MTTGTRFSLLAVCLGAALTAAVAGRAPAASPLTSRDTARPLPLDAVRLTGGPLKRAQDLDASYLLTLDPDRMLALFRTRAGLEPKAPPYPGWDADGHNLTGHVAGHYLSAVSLMWAATGDVRFRQRADYLVDQLKIVQDANGDGYLSALAGGREAFAALARGTIHSAPFELNGLWSPWYTLHKTFAGLRDAYRYTGNRTALEVEVRFAGWADRLLAHLSNEQMQQMLNTEFGGMNEVLADLYADTGEKRWLTLSYRFEHKAVLDPLKRGQDPLDGLHANTQVPKLVGSAARYEYAGNRDDLAAARVFWNDVVGHHTFATGGHGKDEYFREPGRLGQIIDGRTSESCNVYNMLKLMRRLFAFEPKEEYAAFEERALFNHVLGSLDPADGSMCYMVPVGRGAVREYQNMQRSFTCCVGTGMENHALHGYGIYYESPARLWVNLYVPSTASWASTGVQIVLDTDFPEGESAALTVKTAEPKRFTLTLRRPRWAAGGFSARVNGDPVEALPRPGSYLDITRTWRDGDRVTLLLPKTIHLEAVPDNPQRVAILWGPLVLAGDLGPEPAERPPDANGDSSNDGDPIPPGPDVAPVLVAANRPVAGWVAPRAAPGTFRTVGVGRDRDVTLVPFYRLRRRTYAAYWDLLTPAEYDARVAARAADRDRLRRLEALTVAFVEPGDADSRFNPQGERSSLVYANGRAGRRSSRWFSYDVPVGGQPPAALVATYETDNRQPRAFAVLVNGTRIGVARLPASSESRFVDVRYSIPAAVVEGRSRATIRFESLDGRDTAAVFGIRLVRGDAR